MKNAYELAETILKSRPDKNGELKSSDSFTSIELYGISVCKKVQDMKFCECLFKEAAHEAENIFNIIFDNCNAIFNVSWLW